MGGWGVFIAEVRGISLSKPGKFEGLIFEVYSPMHLLI